MIFGGIEEIIKELNDCFIFNFQTNQWTQICHQEVADDQSSVGSHKKKRHTLGGESPETTLSPSIRMTNTKNSTYKTVIKKPKLITVTKTSEKQCDLESPTSVSMKKSFLLKQSDKQEKDFESYWNIVKKKKEGHPAAAQAFGLSHLLLSAGANNSNRQKGRKPAARDGHSANIYRGMFIIFGGDRHQMPFNDMFVLDLEAEFLKLKNNDQ